MLIRFKRRSFGVRASLLENKMVPFVGITHLKAFNYLNTAAFDRFSLFSNHKMIRDDISLTAFPPFIPHQSPL